MISKSYDGSPILYLIPTPIGNMDDITLRAVKVLESVEVIFSEDTRVTGLLLKHLNIKKKLIANHKFNEGNNKEILLKYLSNGYNVGVVSDRGTPAINDPGYYLVLEAISNGYNVVSLPGATAFVPALTVSGLDISRFTYIGFLNSKSSKRIKELEELKFNKETLIFYESPYRLKDMLTDLLLILGNRRISISREISKKYEEVIRGTVSDVIDCLDNVKGEIVVIVSGNNDVSIDEMSISDAVNFYVNLGNSTIDSIKKVARERGLTKNIVYDEYHNLKR